MGKQLFDKATWGALTIILALALALPLASWLCQVVDAAETVPDIAMVWCADVSGSMPTADAQRYWVDAVSLGIDLAPLRTEAAFLAVNDTVVSQTPLLDISQAEFRTRLKQAVCHNGANWYTLSLPSSSKHIFLSRTRQYACSSK